MLKQKMTELCREAGRSLCSKPLCRDGRYQSDRRQQNQNPAHFQNIGPVLCSDSRVNDCRHDKRNNQLKGGFQQLEQRCQNRLLPILLQIFQK